MNTRGAGLAALSVALVAVLAGCGGNATASEPEPVVTPTATEAPVDVEAIARDEIAAIDALGYPTELATWDFEGTFTNEYGGTAVTAPNSDGTSTVTISLDPAGYERWGSDVERSVRSTIRHELGHVWTFWLFPHGVDEPLSHICADVSPDSLDSGNAAAECGAEAVSEILTEQRGGERTRFYDLVLSAESVNSMRPIVAGSLSWQTPTP